MTLGAMHVFLYQLIVSSEWTGTRLHFICEVLAPKKTLVIENFRRLITRKTISFPRRS